jgi:hypothetical protein
MGMKKNLKKLRKDCSAMIALITDAFPEQAIAAEARRRPDLSPLDVRARLGFSAAELEAAREVGRKDVRVALGMAPGESVADWKIVHGIAAQAIDSYERQIDELGAELVDARAAAFREGVRAADHQRAERKAAARAHIMTEALRDIAVGADGAAATRARLALSRFAGTIVGTPEATR